MPLNSNFREFSFPLNVYAQALLLEEKKAQYLHYGLFKDSNTSLNEAQAYSTELVLSQLPSAPCSILEIGVGLGTSIKMLTEKGYQCHGISPDSKQISYIQQQWNNDAPISCERLEDFVSAANRFDVILFQESAQYIDPLVIFNKALDCLRPSGSLIILDEFSLKSSPQSESLHLLDDILLLAKRFNFKLINQRDLSSLATPTLDYLLRVTQKHREQLISDLTLSAEQLNQLDTSNLAYKENYTQGFYGYYLLKFKKDKAPKWRLDYINKVAFKDIQFLFNHAFDQPISHALWEWKYRAKQSQQLCIWENETLIAHYGGMPRNILFFGQEKIGVQIGDVMVSPSKRGALSRNGPFFRLAATFIERYIGFGKPFLIGFGFPNERAMKVASHLNLYDSVGYIEQLSWLSLNKKPQLLTTLRVIEKDAISLFENEINSLWQRMAEDLKGSIIGVRDYAYIVDRYCQHPETTYQILLVKNRLSNKFKGLIITTLNTESCEIIDIISPVKHIPLLIQYTQRFAKKHHCTQVICQISNAFSHYFLTPDAQLTQLNISIASNIWSEGPEPDLLRDRWWLMSGDMDFR